MKRLIKEICVREGKKSQTSIANVRETVSVLMDILAEEEFFEPSPMIDEFNKKLLKNKQEIQSLSIEEMDNEETISINKNLIEMILFHLKDMHGKILENHTGFRAQLDLSPLINDIEKELIGRIL